MKILAFCAIAGALTVLAPVNSRAEEQLQRVHLNSGEQDIGYTQIVQKGDTLYIAGIVASGDTLDAQMRGIYDQIGRILKPYGADSRNIIRETIYTRDIEALKNAIPTRKLFYSADMYPSSTWVQIDRLYNKSDLIEIEVEAVVSGRR